MDLVTWDQGRFSDAINRKLGMDAVVYTQPDTTSSVLQQDILKVCLKSFMTEEITNSQKRVASENNFTFGCSEDGDLTFDGESAANEAGHIANLSNQLCAILYDIRIETLQEGAAHHGINQIRKCPHCGLKWAKIVGCEGTTTCGSRFWDLDSTTNGIMATFTFNILKDASKTGLEIIKIGQKQL